ncbi:sickle tail protein homolog isoform X2 [Cebus imitator]|uniref:sickle tail protein homolog isoform X2 n=1 Tax=Cebus imitator TaxID=2715852 RepID=UPI00189AA9B7|nr:sickle tail protein homolog isoform X2 [Cebus imitator]
MSKPSRLARPFFSNAASKLPSAKRDDLNSKQKKISLGEKILRTGSEGNLVKQQQVQTAATPAQRKAATHKEQGKGNLHVTSLEDAECRRTKERLSNGNSRGSVSKSSRNIPRRHTLGGARSSKEILGMQTSEMDRKREAFLEHLKQKYPHHASAIMGHQERLRDQALKGMLISLQAELDIQRYLMKIESSQRTRSPKLSHSPQPPSLGDPVEHLSETSADSLEAMSEGDAPTPFSRGSRTRASLPVVRSTNQTKERSLGVLYLQYGDETKHLRMPNEITSADTIRALFVSAFPQQLTMKMLESPSVAIYIKDESRNVYYELNDVRNIQDRSLLKVYNKDPAHAFNHTPKTMNGDMRMQREFVYARGDGPGASRPGSTAHPPHAIPNSPPSTPVPHSMPPSPSRIPYGGPRSIVVPGNATIPRDRISSLPVSRPISPSPSAILERRDVKPDEDMSGKNIAMYRNEGFYADPYLYHEGRMSIASSHGGHPLDVPDHIIAYHRTAIRSASAYCNPSMQAEMHMEQSLYRQKSRKYPDSHLPTLGSKTPPASPHRVSDLRMIDMHAHYNAHGPPHTMQPDRVSPSRQAFKKEPGTLVYIEKPRSAPGLSSLVDLGPPLVEKQVFAYSTATIPKDRETRERMQAMEKQIASLTGLVQSALFKGPITSYSKDASSEKMMKTTANRNHTDSAGTPHVSGGKTLSALESTVPPSQPPPAGTSAIHMSLLEMRRSVAELRLQLQQMRQLQLQNQELLRAMMKKAELEISGKVMETMKRLEDPVQRQRVLVEQERQKYLHEEEKIVKKLRELEDFVEDLKKDSTSASRAVTLKDVEDGAFLLRQVGEAVATLKGEFPTLQNKMRAILRIEVEAVRFLKEEPHKLDSLLKRVRSMTDILTMLRRHVTDGLLKGTDAAQAAQYMAMEKATAAEVLKSQEEAAHTSGQPLHSSGAPGDAKSEVVPLSGMTVHHAQSSPVVIQPSQHSVALLNPAQNLPHAASPPAVPPEATSTLLTSQAPQSPQTPMNGSAMQSLFIEEIHSASAKNRAVSIEKAEKKWEEKRQNLDHYNGKEFEKLLEEAQANIMKSIPNLEMPPATGPLPRGDAPVDKLELSDSPNSERDLEKLGGKSPPPPPPPPRRSYLPGSGLTTTRSGDVVYTGRKENITAKGSSEDAGPSPQTRAIKCPAEEPASAWTSSPPPVTTSSSKDEEEEEEEGEKIMAELQAFQKCSFMDVNSNSHAEPSRADNHVKDARSGATVPPKEKKGIFGSWRTKQSKNLEFFHEDVRKSDVEYENGPQMEFRKVTTGALRPSDPPKWERGMENSISDASRTSEYKTEIIMKENSISNASLLRDSRNYSQKSMPKVNFSFSGISSLEDEINKGSKVSGLQYSIPDIENQKLNYGKAKEVEKQTTDACHISSPTRLTELSGHDFKTEDQEVVMTDFGQAVLRFKGPRHANLNPHEDGESSPSSPTEENAATDNIAFMITKTTVQVLSSGEVHDIVSQKGEDIQTVNIDARKEMTPPQEGTDHEEPVVCLDKKPVIIIFDEPMDIRSAYKRLSTIFEECDEELERMMMEEKIEEEEEEENGDPVVQNNKSSQMSPKKVGPGNLRTGQQVETKSQPHSLATETRIPGGQDMNRTELNKFSYADSPNSECKGDDVTDDQFESPKKKFKFKFPKKQLAALTQAIRTGTKTGKKTLQVVVYEEEEEDGTLKQHKEAKRFEITSSQPEDTPKNMMRRPEQPSIESTSQISRTDEIRKNTYRTLDSLEQTIKQLENTISEMSPKALVDTSCSSNRDSVASSSHIAQEASPRPLLVPDEVPTALEPPTSIPSASRKGSSGAPQTSRMPIPMSTKNRPGTLDKPGKQSKLQDPRQYRQANGSAKKSGGDFKPTSPSLPASKIPALSPSSGKSSSLPSSSGDSSNLPNPPATKPSIASNPLSPQTGPPAHSASLIPSVSNGSLKFQSLTHTGKGHHLSFSLQSQNGRAPPPLSFSSSPPSPASSVSLTQGAKGTRTIHAPSLTSYKAQNGSSSKATPSTAKETS